MQKTSKIAFISAMTRVPWGGSEALWHGAAMRLMERGHTVGISVKARKPLPNPVIDLCQSGASLQTHHPYGFIGSGLLHLRERFLPFWRKHARLESWLRSFQADLVCVSGGNFKDGYWALEILNRLSIPYVIVVQANTEWLWPSDSERERLLRIYRDAKAVFCVSRANLELLEDQLATRLSNAEVVRNPFNLDWDQPSSWPMESEPLRMACVGRLEPDAKGQDLIIKCLARPEWADRAVEVSFFGEGASSQSLEELARREQVLDKVRFCGNTNDIAAVWRDHHVLLLPSRYEGLPLALVEAMLCGRPSVVTDVAGHCEVVADGVEGFVAKAANQALWNDAMERLWSQQLQLCEMGERARTRARQEFPEDPCAVFADKLVGLID
jgi:glycosyltransferase involved in cell wall biosynthesis